MGKEGGGGVRGGGRRVLIVRGGLSDIFKHLKTKPHKIWKCVSIEKPT